MLCFNLRAQQFKALFLARWQKLCAVPQNTYVYMCVWVPLVHKYRQSVRQGVPILIFSLSYAKLNLARNTHSQTRTHTHILTSSASRKHIQITGNKLTQIPHRRYIRCYRCCCFCCCCWVCEFSASASLPKSTLSHTHTQSVNSGKVAEFNAFFGVGGWLNDYF